MTNDKELYSDEGTNKAFRRNFSEEELQEIKDRLLESVYADIGKGIVKKFLWLSGTLLVAVFAWMIGAGKIVLGG